MKNDKRKKKFSVDIPRRTLLFVTFLFLRSKYKNEWIDLCAEHGHR